MENNNKFNELVSYLLIFQSNVSLSCHLFPPLQLRLGINVRIYESSVSPQDLKLSIFAL